MPQRLNWTERKRISRDDASINIDRTQQVPRFSATINLARYRLPPEAIVVVEAYRQTTWRRFGFGTVALIRPESNCALAVFGAADAVLFRLKVLAANGEGRILAEADQLRVTELDEARGPRRSLLPVFGEDIGEEIHQLSFAGSGGSPLLVMNRKLGDWRRAARTSQFRALVYPELFRQILARALRDFDPDNRDWQNEWITFASRLPGMGAPPEEAENETARSQWAADAVDAFCRAQQFLTKYASAVVDGDES